MRPEDGLQPRAFSLRYRTPQRLEVPAQVRSLLRRDLLAKALPIYGLHYPASAKGWSHLNLKMLPFRWLTSTCGKGLVVQFMMWKAPGPSAAVHFAKELHLSDKP